MALLMAQLLLKTSYNYYPSCCSGWSVKTKLLLSEKLRAKIAYQVNIYVKNQPTGRIVVSVWLRHTCPAKQYCIFRVCWCINVTNQGIAIWFGWWLYMHTKYIILSIIWCVLKLLICNFVKCMVWNYGYCKLQQF